MKFNWVTKDGKHYPVRANSINNPATKNNISIGIIWGMAILLGLKKSGRPIANNKIDK